MKCEICNQEVDGLKGLSCHLVKQHKFNKKEYYDKYLKKQNEGKCSFCQNDSIFLNLTKGYHKICNSKECLGKTRATGTYQFLMYKYNLSEKDAIILMNQRALERGVKITEGLENSFKKNDKFFKEKSHQSKDYWLKRGFTEEEALNKIKIITDNIHKKTSEKRRNKPELYTECYPNQLKYWLKKGYNEDDAKQKVYERQLTFTLEKCIKKHGEIRGLEIWNDRQIKWSIKMKDTLINNGNYKKDFSIPEKELVETLIEKLKIKDDEHHSCLNEQFYIYDTDTKKIFIYDFILKANKKVIEFNGDYWHCNPIKYKTNFFNKRKQKFAYEIWDYDNKKINKIKEKGYEVLIIWEYDYNNQRKQTIQRCIDFLTN